MGRSNQFDPYRGGGSTGIIDENLGLSYDIVRHVYENLAGISLVSINMDEILAANATLSALEAATTLIGDFNTAVASTEAAKLVALNARDAALAVYDSFDDRYLGAFEEAPITDNDGDELIKGTIYFNTNGDLGQMMVWSGPVYGWVAAYTSGEGFAPIVHNHDDRYYTKNQTNTLLGDKTPIEHIGSRGDAHANVVAGGDSGFMTGAQATKLAGIEEGATQNSSDAALTARENHTGTQAINTVSGLQEALDDKQPSGTYVTTASFTWDNLGLKPTTLSGFGITDAVASSAFTFANLGSKPTSLAGFGITDAVKKTGDTMSGNLGFALSNFYISTSGNNAYFNFDANDTLGFDRTNDACNFTIAGWTPLSVVFNAVRPGADNSISLGIGGLRWAQIFVASGVINTSDAREKHWLGDLTPAELAAGKEIGAALGKYQWLAAIAEKGSDEARVHIGVRAQAVWDIMARRGLVDPIGEDGRPGYTPYGFLCFDEWEDQFQEATEAVEFPAVLDDDGNERAPARTEQIATGEQVLILAAGNRYGLRMDELLIFIAAAQEQRLLALEAQLG